MPACVTDTGIGTARVAWEDRAARVAALSLLVYWAVFALVTLGVGPDVMEYHLGRLWIVHTEGLIGNPVWTNQRQMVFPWGFDAVHYPFLFLGTAHALPSFLCFLGICAILHRLAAKWCGPERAWWFVLALLAMPNFVYQATTSKNDLVIVFSVLAWFYARRLWLAEPRRLWLAIMALALGFAAGAKTSGLLFALPLAGMEAVRLGVVREWRMLRRWCGYAAVSFFLLGSGEIYYNNLLYHPSVLGSEEFLSLHRNSDGVWGMVGNLIRYFWSNLALGFEPAGLGLEWANFCEASCNRMLQFAALSDSGVAGAWRGAALKFTRNGRDILSDFGLIGSISLLSAFPNLFGASENDRTRRRIVVAGFISLALIAATIGWSPSNSRFALVPFTCFATAFVHRLIEYAARPQARSWVMRGWLLLFVLGAVLAPLVSFNRRPSDILRAIVDREAYRTAERPGAGLLLEMLAAIMAHDRDHEDWEGRPTLCVAAGPLAPVALLFERKEWETVVIGGPNWRGRLDEVKDGLRKPVYILFWNYLPPKPMDPAFQMVSTLPMEPMTFVGRWESTAKVHEPTRANAIQKPQLQIDRPARQPTEPR